MSAQAVICGDTFAPITSSAGFLRGQTNLIVNGLVEWRQQLHGEPDVKRLAGGLLDNVGALEPLTEGTRPRELIVATRNPDWVDAQLARNPQWINEQIKKLAIQGDLFA